MREFGGWNGSYSTLWIDTESALLRRLEDRCGCTNTTTTASIQPSTVVRDDAAFYAMDLSGYTRRHEKKRAPRKG